MRAALLLLMLFAYAGSARAAACAGNPRWLGINASGVMEFCGVDGQVHPLAAGDTVGAPAVWPTPGTAPTPQTFPTPIPTAWPTAGPTVAPTATAAPTPGPTLVPQPTPARLSAVYAPASLAANTSRCDTVTVTGLVTGRALSYSPGVSPATGCVIAGAWPSGANTATVCWRNTFAATTACQTPSSTWSFTQP